MDGLPAAAGIAKGRARVLHWTVPTVPHHTVSPDQVDEELRRFDDARSTVKARLQVMKRGTVERIGSVESQIFDPQLAMLDDPEVVDRVRQYIRENHLPAVRAFEWRVLELEALWTRTNNPMVLDRVNDLVDLQIRVLHVLLDLPDPWDISLGEEPVVIVAQNLTPSLTVQFDPKLVRGLATDLGTRTSHWAILARSLKIPAVVGLGDLMDQVTEGQEIIVDGHIGRVVLDPDDQHRTVFREREEQIRVWEEETALIAGLEAETMDGEPVSLRANLDLPSEAHAAKAHGAQGIGLMRTEFLIVGRSSMPAEDDQYEAYRSVAKEFPSGTVIIRTFDLGGDKFPMFLHMPREENPFLGWRAIRVCLDQPEFFRTQLRAILRATAHGDIRILLPMVNDVDEVLQVRSMLSEIEIDLQREGVPYNPGTKVGVLIETPAAALDAVELSRHSDFFSIGTNDLVQYTLAVDRTNSRLADLYNPFHPSVIRLLHQVSRVARAAGVEVSVCGEMAAHPLGAFLIMGLNIHALSVAWPALPEIKKVIREFRIEDARKAAGQALAAPTSQDAIRCLVEGIGESTDLAAFSGRWNLSLPQ